MDRCQRRVSLALVGGLVPCGCFFLSIYFQHSEGLGPVNLSLMDSVEAVLACLRGPWIIGGDFNMTPDQLASSGWLDKIGGVIVAPHDHVDAARSHSAT